MHHVDQLAARRDAKQHAMLERPMTPLEALEEGDRLAVRLIGLSAGELVVDAQVVLEAARRIDEIVLGLRNLELDRGAQ